MTKNKTTRVIATGALPSRRSARSLISKHTPEPTTTRQEMATGACDSEPPHIDPASVHNMESVYELVGIHGPKFAHKTFAEYRDFISLLSGRDLDLHAEELGVFSSGSRELLLDRLETNYLRFHRAQRVAVAQSRQREVADATTAEEKVLALTECELRREKARANEKQKELGLSLTEQALRIARHGI